MKNFIVYQKLGENDFLVIYSDNDNKAHRSKRLPSTEKYNQFHIFKGYKSTAKGVRAYYNDFRNWCEELKNNDIMKIYYSSYKTHFFAVKNTFTKLQQAKHIEMDPIDYDESQFIEKCYNSGLMYCTPG